MSSILNIHLRDGSIRRTTQTNTRDAAKQAGLDGPLDARIAFFTDVIASEKMTFSDGRWYRPDGSIALYTEDVL